MSKFWKKALAIFAVIAMCLFVFAACTPEVEGGGGNENPSVTPPTQEEINLENLTKFGVILAESLGQNPNDGFYVDLTAALGFEFAAESKQKYNWSYDLSLKAGVFVNDTEAIALEIKDKLASAEQIAAGDDVVFGLYNTSEGNMYLQIRQMKDGTVSYLRYNFSDAPISTAIKSILIANGVDLDVVIRDITVIAGENGKEDTSLGNLLSTALGMISGICDKVEIKDNDFIVTTSYKKIYGFLSGLVGLIPGVGEGETLDTLLPDEVKAMLPEDLSLDITFKTDGKILTGVKLTNSFLDMTGEEDDGTFNFNADFAVAKTVPAGFDVDAIVNANTALAGVAATKVLNLDASGKIDLTKTVDGATVTARALSWKIKANVDVLKLIEKNLQFTDEAINDNFLQLQLTLGEQSQDTTVYTPVIDFAWGPEKLGSTDLLLAVNYKALLPLILGDTAGLVLQMIEFFPSYVMLPLTDSALGALIGGTGGAIPVIGEGGSGEGGGSTDGGETSIDIQGIVKTITNLLKEIELNNGQMLINVQNVLNMFGLDSGTKETLNMILGYSETAKLFDNKAVYADNAIADYDLKNDLKTANGADREYTMAEASENLPLVTAILNAKLETVKKGDKEYLKVFDNDSDTVRLDASATPVTAGMLNTLIGTGYVRYSGTDFLGHEFKNGKFEYTYGDGKKNTYCLDAIIRGYVGLDETKIGIPQEITIVTGSPNGIGLLQFINSLSAFASAFGITLPDLDLPLYTFKANVILGEVANVTATVTDPNAGGADIESKYYTAFDKFDGSLDIVGTITYKPSAAFPYGATRSVVVAKEDSRDATKLAYISKVNCDILQNSESQQVVGADKDFTIELSVFGEKVVKNVHVIAPDSVKVYVKDGKDTYFIGDTVSKTVNSLIAIDYTYGDQTSAKMQLNSSDITWANKDEMIREEVGLFGSVKYKAKKTGVLKMNPMTLNGKRYSFDFYIVQTSASKIVDVTKEAAADGTDTIHGTLNVSGEGILDAAGRTIKTVLSMKSYTANSSTLTNVDGVTFLFDGDVTAFPSDLSGGLSLPFTITGVPKSVLNYTLQITITFDGQITEVKAVDTGTVAFEDSIAKVKEATENATLGNALSSTTVRLVTANEGYAYLFWDSTAKKYVFRKNDDASKTIDAIVSFKDKNGDEGVGYNPADGKVKTGTVGTFTVSAVGYESLGSVSIPVSFPKIEVTTKPTKLSYTVGEAFDSTGIAVKKTINGTETTLTAGEYEIDSSSFAMDKVGTYTILVKLAADKTRIAKFTVTVLDSFRLKKSPTKTTYTVGESLDLAGLVLKKSVGGIESDCVPTTDYTVDSSKFKSGTVGEYDIVFTYVKDTTKKVTIKVKVISAFFIEYKPIKTEYTIGEKFDASGLVVKKSVGGVVTELGDGEYVIDLGVFNKDAAGRYTITIKLASDPTKFDTFEVVVRAEAGSVKGVLTTNGRSLPAITEGWGFSADGLEVKFTPEGETTARTLSPNEYDIDSSAFKSKIGEYEIIVKLVANPEITVSYKVSVVADW